ncbi:tyrosine-type recombinase/integrase [Streptomyces sp. NPDC054950]
MLRTDHSQSAGHTLFYAWLRALGTLPDDAPATLRNLSRATGQVSVEQLVDRYHLQCRPVRDLLVDHLKERQPGLDYATLDNISRFLARSFWADLEAHHTVVRVAKELLDQARLRLDAVREAPAGGRFEVLGETFTRAKRPGSTWVYDHAGGRRDLARREHRAFWGWATIEFLQHTGAGIEEMLEASHHSLIQYRLPTTGEVVPLLQIAPTKTDQERVLLVSPELADVLSTIITRIRDPRTGAVPRVVAYDYNERVWNPPMPLLFQYDHSGDPSHMTGEFLRACLNDVLEATGLTDASGLPLDFHPYDFRRIFITDAIRSGLPPHIAQVIAGHADINTTMGQNAIYPAEAIEAHRAFIARRRSLRPSEEYRTPTAEEWDAFFGHFERRKLSIGICARALGTSCIHEHACFSELAECFSSEAPPLALRFRRGALHLCAGGRVSGSC